jgi:hypothetical protein
LFFHRASVRRAANRAGSAVLPQTSSLEMHRLHDGVIALVIVMERDRCFCVSAMASSLQINV